MSATARNYPRETVLRAATNIEVLCQAMKKVLDKKVAVKQVIRKLVSFPPEKTSPPPGAIPVSPSRIIVSIGGSRFAVDITTTATPLLRAGKDRVVE